MDNAHGRGNLEEQMLKVRAGPSAESTPLGGAAPQISLRSAAPCSPRTKVTPMHLFLELLEDGGQISVLRLMLKQEIYIYTFTYIHTCVCVCVCPQAQAMTVTFSGLCVCVCVHRPRL